MLEKRCFRKCNELCRNKFDGQWSIDNSQGQQFSQTLVVVRMIRSVFMISIVMGATNRSAA